MLSTKTTEFKNEIPGTTGFIATLEFNRLTTICFDARTRKALKSLVSKKQVDNAFDIADKIGEKSKKLSEV